MSGYQESLVPIFSLAEAAGIRQAVEEFFENENYRHWYCCAVRAIPRQSEDDHSRPLSERLFACVAGERRPYTRTGSYMLDSFPEDSSYLEFYEDLNEELVDSAAKQNPGITHQAYINWWDYLLHVWDTPEKSRGRRWRWR